MNSDHCKLEILTWRDYLEITLTDCMLARTTVSPQQVTGHEEVDNPAKFLVSDVQLLEAKLTKDFAPLLLLTLSLFLRLPSILVAGSVEISSLANATEVLPWIYHGCVSPRMSIVALDFKDNLVSTIPLYSITC